MEKYFCDCCNRILDAGEVNGIWDDSLNEGFICCKNCGAECSCYDEEEELDYEDDFGAAEEFDVFEGFLGDLD